MNENEDGQTEENEDGDVNENELSEVNENVDYGENEDIGSTFPPCQFSMQAPITGPHVDLDSSEE